MKLFLHHEIPSLSLYTYLVGVLYYYYLFNFLKLIFMKVDMSFIPDGVSGIWEVSTFEVKERELSQMISLIKTGRGCPGGTYKKLSRNGAVIMSNTPDEIHDFIHFVLHAQGNVLINGLGLGCVIKALLEKDRITKITVIEQSEDVIKLIAPHFTDSRIEIINANAFNYVPPKGVKYDYVWHDIWDNICSDNLEEMGKLHRKYGRKTEWQDSWAKGECQRQKRQDNRYSYYR